MEIREYFTQCVKLLSSLRVAVIIVKSYVHYLQNKQHRQKNGIVKIGYYGDLKKSNTIITIKWISEMNACVNKRKKYKKQQNIIVDSGFQDVCFDFGFYGRLWKCESTNCDIWSKEEVGEIGGCAGWAWGGSRDTLLALQFNHCIPREVLTVVLWKLLKLLSKVKWNCSLSRQHWENKGICSWLLINVKRDQHKGFIKLYITGVI